MCLPNFAPVTRQEGKISSIVMKINGRLTSDVLQICVSEGDSALQQKGLHVVSQLRSMKAKLIDCISLVQSLSSTSGEAFHHSYLKNALEKARNADVLVTKSVDVLLAVRHVSSLAESQNWEALVAKLASHLAGLEQQSQTEIRLRGCVHAVESVMRQSLVGGAESDEVKATENRRTAALERCASLENLVGEFCKNDTLSKDSSLEVLRSEFLHVQTLCKALHSQNQMNSVEVSECEEARAMLSAKNSNFQKAFCALPLGVWIMDELQECLARYHAHKALLNSLENAFLGQLFDNFT